MIDTKVVLYHRGLPSCSLIRNLKVVGMNWIEVPAGKYNIVSDAGKRSYCQIEISVRFVGKQKRLPFNYHPTQI
jgi:hypothetical protein